MIMEDLMNVYGWQLNKASLLDIKGTELVLSVFPEYTYWSRDERGMLYRSRTPNGLKLNCAVKKPFKNNETGEVIYENEMFVEFTTEEEFYDFMIGIKGQFAIQKQLA